MVALLGPSYLFGVLAITSFSRKAKYHWGEAQFLMGEPQMSPNAIMFIVDSTSDEYWKASSGAEDMYGCVVAAQVVALRAAGHTSTDFVVGVSATADGRAVASTIAAINVGVRIFSSTIGSFYTPAATFGVATELEAALLAQGTQKMAYNTTFSFFRANILKGMAVSMYMYDTVTFMDLDLFPAGKAASSSPFVASIHKNNAIRCIGSTSPGSPFAGALFVVRPSRVVYRRLFGLLQGGFHPILGWGQRGETLPARPDLGGFSYIQSKAQKLSFWQYLAWDNTACSKASQYCSRRKNTKFHEWTFFGAGADQGLLYATFAYEPSEFVTVSARDWKRAAPFIHFYGLQNKPWAVNTTAMARQNIQLFGSSWKSVAKIVQFPQGLQCAALLNARFLPA